MDDQAGRHARALDQAINPQHRSFRSQPLRLSELGIPEHRENSVPVPVVQRRSPPLHIGRITQTLLR